MYRANVIGVAKVGSVDPTYFPSLNTPEEKKKKKDKKEKRVLSRGLWARGRKIGRSVPDLDG